MRITQVQPNHYISNNVNFGGYRYSPYNPNNLSHKMSPVITYMDRLFKASLAVSRLFWNEKMQDLIPYIKEVKTNGWNNIPNVMWDINKNDSKSYVMIMHGLSNNISSLQKLYLKIINKTKFAVLAPEYSGFAQNSNKKVYLDPKILLEDVSEGLKYLRDKGIKDENVYVLGHSFGGFVATELAEKNKNLGRLVLVSSTDSFKHCSDSIIGGHTDFVPKRVQYLLEHSAIARLFTSSIFSTKKHLKHVEVPVDFIHAQNDRLVKIYDSKELSTKCKNLHSFITLKDGGHKMDDSKMEAVVELLNGVTC